MDDAIEPRVQAETPNSETELVLSAKRAILIFVAFFLTQIVVGFVFAFAAIVYLVATQRITDPSSISGEMVPFTLPIAVLGVTVAGMIAFLMTRQTLRGPIGRGALAPLGWRPSAVSSITAASLTGCILSLVYILILVPASPPEQGQVWGPIATAASLGGWPRHIWMVLALVVAPAIEEFIFRGVLLGGLSNALGIRTAAIIVSVIFVVLHVTETLGYWPAWVGISLLACAAVLFRIKTGSLLPAIATHAGYNLVLVFVVYLGFA